MNIYKKKKKNQYRTKQQLWENMVQWNLNKFNYIYGVGLKSPEQFVTKILFAHIVNGGIIIQSYYQ